MRILMLIFCLPAILPQIAGSQELLLRIRLLNGKTGKPISDEKLNIFVDGVSHTYQLLQPDSQGYITIKINGAESLRLATNLYNDCREKPWLPQEKKYLVSEILARGLVTANTCGKQTATPSPGEITLFERNRTFIEGMRL